MSTTKQSANFIVESPNPPEMHNVLWMDTSIYNNPVLKAWINGEWKQTYTDQSKAINLMAHSIYDLCEENKSVSGAIASQEETIEELVKTQAAPNIESELQTGKTAVANAITNKGVETSSNDSLAVMANKIGEIQTQEITIDGGEMYPSYFYGKSLHNLFEVATEIKNSGTYDDYAGFIVGQMYKGYATFDLSKIAADAYLTSDGDFYTSVQIHTWHDEDDGYSDRYIVFFYTNENYNFRSTIDGVCPRQIIVVGKCNSIYIDYNRLTQLYIFTELGGSLSNFSVGNNTPQGNWTFTQNLKGYISHSSGKFFKNVSNVGFVSFGDLKNILGGTLFLANSNNTFNNLNCVTFLNLENVSNGNVFECSGDTFANVTNIDFPELKQISNGKLFIIVSGSGFSKVSYLNFPKLEECNGSIIEIRSGAGNTLKLLSILVPKLKYISGGSFISMYNNSDIYQELTTLEFPSLIQISNGNVIAGYANRMFTKLQYISLPQLKTLHNGKILSITTDGGTENSFNVLSYIDASNLETISGNSYVLGEEIKYSGHINNLNNLTSIRLNSVKNIIDSAKILKCYSNSTEISALTELSLPSIENYTSSENNVIPINFTKLYLGYFNNNRNLSVTPRFTPVNQITDIELKQGWCKPLRLDLASTALTKENIVNHILNRLGTNTGSPITITLGATNLAKLTNEEKAIATNKGFTLA